MKKYIILKKISLFELSLTYYINGAIIYSISRIIQLYTYLTPFYAKMSYLLYITFTFGSIFVLVSSGANNSYANCLTIVAKFSNTITGPVQNITATTGVTVKCSQLTGSACPGTIVNGTCTWKRKLAVSCKNGSTVRIRVQSNGLPGRCGAVPSTVAFKETDIDFEVNFNPAVSINTPYQSPSTQSQLNAIVCNITSQATVPSASSYVGYSNSNNLRTLAGLAIDGVPILNVNSANQVDPFYPTGGYAAESVDSCLSHPSGSGVYHYHISSGCIVSPPTGNITACDMNTQCKSKIANYSLQSYPTSAKKLTVIGIAKDGHIIYGPYTSAGVQVQSGFDICNGMFHDSVGNYGYFATTTYPYITGCFGPGNYPSFTPNCTKNGPKSYVKSSFG